MRLENQDGQTLLVHSIFYTIQGEGPFAGRPAVFIRLGGCNIQCPGCDTEYSAGAKQMALEDIAGQALTAPIDGQPVSLVVITGGEPFRQNITPLCRRLFAGLVRHVQVETNGTLHPSPELPGAVTVVCSPKTPVISPTLAARANAFKYVVSRNDRISATTGLPHGVLGANYPNHVARPPAGFDPAAVFIQPMDEQDGPANFRNLTTAATICLRYGYRLSVQLHKLVGLA